MGQDNLEREGVIKSLTSATMEVNSVSLKSSWLFSSGVQSPWNRHGCFQVVSNLLEIVTAVFKWCPISLKSSRLFSSGVQSPWNRHGCFQVVSNLLEIVTAVFKWCPISLRVSDASALHRWQSNGMEFPVLKIKLSNQLSGALWRLVHVQWEADSWTP